MYNWSSLNQMSNFKMEKLINNKQAAQWLKISSGTLSNSRNTGKLFGKIAPPYVKIGGSVKYDFMELKDWFNSIKEPINHPILDWNYNSLLMVKDPEIIEDTSENILVVFKITKYSRGEVAYELFDKKITSYVKAVKEWGGESIVPISDGKHLTFEKWAKLPQSFITYGIESLIESESKPLTPMEIVESMNKQVEMFHSLASIMDSEVEVVKLREKTDSILSQYSDLMVKSIQEGLNNLNGNDS